MWFIWLLNTSEMGYKTDLTRSKDKTHRDWIISRPAQCHVEEKVFITSGKEESLDGCLKGVGKKTEVERHRLKTDKPVNELPHDDTLVFWFFFFMRCHAGICLLRHSESRSACKNTNLVGLGRHAGTIPGQGLQPHKLSHRHWQPGCVSTQEYLPTCTIHSSITPQPAHCLHAHLGTFHVV